MNRMVKKYLALVLVVIAAFASADQFDLLGLINGDTQHTRATAQAQPQSASTARDTNGSDVIARAFRSKSNDVPVEGQGRVTAVLDDDTRGSQHQRFILRLASGDTVLVAHNIDLAPRIPSLRKGELVGFKGIYEYNDRGGVIHWTHRDPDGRHAAGWLEHDGQRYQ